MPHFFFSLIPLTSQIVRCAVSCLLHIAHIFLHVSTLVLKAFSLLQLLGSFGICVFPFPEHTILSHSAWHLLWFLWLTTVCSIDVYYFLSKINNMKFAILTIILNCTIWWLLTFAILCNCDISITPCHWKNLTIPIYLSLPVPPISNMQ